VTQARTSTDPTGDTWQSRPVPWNGVISRFQAATRARWLVPTELALIGTDLVYRSRIRFSPSRASDANASMAAVVGGTHREAEVARLAPMHVAAGARGWEQAGSSPGGRGSWNESPCATWTGCTGHGPRAGA
jgi:hypothetical protein